MKMIKLFFLSIFLAPFVFSMDAQESAKANKEAICDYFLNGVSDNPELRDDLSDAISFALKGDFAQVLDDEMKLEQILGYCNSRIMKCNFERFADPDSVLIGINTKELNFIEKKILIKLMIRELYSLFTEEEQNKLEPLLYPLKIYKNKPSSQEIILEAEKRRQELLQVRTKHLLDKIPDNHKLKYWLSNMASAMLIKSGELKKILKNQELVDDFLEYYNNLIITHNLQKHAFLPEDLMGVEIELLSPSNKRALMELIVNNIHHLLPTFALSMHTCEEPRGRQRFRELDRKGYYLLREKTEQLLDRISNDHPLKLNLVKVASISFLLTQNDLDEFLNDEKLVKLFIKQYYENIVTYLLHKHASLDGDPWVIIELNPNQKRNLAMLIMHKIRHLLPNRLPSK